ncbi:MAG: Hint domain-containing protein [Pseudomonadota bacterium]
MPVSTTTTETMGTFDGLDATLQLTVPDKADEDFSVDIQLSQAGVEPDINVVFAIDRSGSTSNSTGLDLDGDGDIEDFLEAQIYAVEQSLLKLVDAGNDPADISVTIVDYAGSANSFTATLDNTDALQAYIAGLSSGGVTNYQGALAEIESALDATPGAADDTNIVYFYSDGFPFPPNQDFSDELESLEDSYAPTIFGVGVGNNADEDALAEIDSTGEARIVTSEEELLELVETPPPLPNVENFQIFVDGVLVDTILPTDEEVVTSATGLSISGLNVTDYVVLENSEQTVDVQVVVNFTNGESLGTVGDVEIIDSTVEGTVGSDLIDINYDQDPEGDMVDNEDNVTATDASELNDDTIFGFEGDDTINAGVGDDQITGGVGNDTFVEIAGEGSDTVTDFGADDTGSIDDGDQTNNDFVDLSGFYDDAALEAYNDADDDPTNDLSFAIGLLRADAEDGKLDGIIGGSDFTAAIGDIDLTLLDGNGVAVSGESLTFDNTNVACFVRGTQIATRRGSVGIEELSVGDEVVTMDNGFQKIRWIGSTTVPAEGALAPIMFCKGAMGNERDLQVSPQHRMLVRGWHVELMFGRGEALVPAKALINDKTVFSVEGGNVQYFHMMFDRHEIVYAEGCPSESFNPGQEGLGSFSEDAREEILSLFPELRKDSDAYGQKRRPSLKVQESRVLADSVGN